MVDTNGNIPALNARGPVLVVVSDTGEYAEWITGTEWDGAGITLASTLGPSTPADVQEINQHLAAVKPDACLVLGDGVLSRLVRLLADLANLPVFALVTNQEQLENLPRRRKTKPDLFFVAHTELLPAALEDDRYGSTLLATGHPARDLTPAGPSSIAARQRILAIIQEWWRGETVVSQPDLSVVVPAYREAGNIPTVCERLVDALDRDGLRAEIVIVDDGSPDDTYKVALAQMWRSPRIRPCTKGPPRGMGNAIKFGLQRARGPIVAITMGDGSDEVSRIPEMFRKVRDEHYGLAIGSRYRRRANYEAVPHLYRFWSAIFRYTTWALVGLRLRDYTNAFRVFRRSVLDRQGLEGGGFEISPEITFKAWFATRQVAEVDVKHLKRGTGQSNFSFLRAGPGYARMLLKALLCRITGRWIILDW
jgi:dolichol-phosphate mannosyltransferase